jgi:hypothetical protein
MEVAHNVLLFAKRVHKLMIYIAAPVTSGDFCILMGFLQLV